MGKIASSVVATVETPEENLRARALSAATKTRALRAELLAKYPHFLKTACPALSAATEATSPVATAHRA